MAGSKIVAGYNRPFPLLRSLLCLAQRGFPLLAAVVPGPLVYKDGVGNFEGAMRRAMEAGCVTGTVKFFCSGFADRAKEGPGQRSYPCLMDHAWSPAPGSSIVTGSVKRAWASIHSMASFSDGNFPSCIHAGFVTFTKAMITAAMKAISNRACEAAFSHHLAGSNPNHEEIGMAGANRTLSPKRAAERMHQHRHAVMVLASQSATKAIKAQLRAQGVKLSEVSAKDINIQADTYFDVHRERLIAEAEHTIETWPGFARYRVGAKADIS